MIEKDRDEHTEENARACFAAPSRRTTEGCSGAVLERFNPSTGATDLRENLSGHPVAVMVSGSTVWVVQYDGWLDRFTLSPN